MSYMMSHSTAVNTDPDQFNDDFHAIRERSEFCWPASSAAVTPAMGRSLAVAIASPRKAAVAAPPVPRPGGD
jgi:hypothetical protein